MTSYPTHRHRNAFSLIELLCAIVLMLILTAIAAPVLNHLRRSSINTTSASQMRQITMAALMFAADHQGNLPWRTNREEWHKSAFGKRADSEYFISGVMIDPYLPWESRAWYDPFALEAQKISIEEIPHSTKGGWAGRVRCNPAYTEASPNWFYNRPKPIALDSIVTPSNALLFFVGDPSSSGVGKSASPPFADDYAMCGFADGSVRRVSIPPNTPHYIRDMYCRLSQSSIINNRPNTLTGFDY